PVAPATYQLFLHTPTGRKVLMQYDGSNWMPIISLGAFQVYVDATDGTDSINQGGAVDSDAFATVQYAVNQVPPLYGGTVTISVNAETYNETVTIRGKVPTGSYTLILEGTLVEDQSGTSSANGVKGTGAIQGNVTDLGNMAGHADKLIYLDSDGDYRIIDTVGANWAAIASTFTSQPLSGENYIIYDWGTEISKLLISPGQENVAIYDIHFYGSGNSITGSAYSNMTLYRCKTTNGDVRANNCNINIWYCYSQANGGTTIWASVLAKISIIRSKAINEGNT
ncbi:unnamed protein product, partial [marine sediment metagenome]